MKILKLSLVATLTASALSSLSATLLEEAIKDIDVSGFARYRFQSDNYKRNADDDYISKKDGKFHIVYHRFSLDVNFKTTLDDNFFSVIGLRYDSRDILGSHAYENSGISNTHGGLTGINVGWGDKNHNSFSARQYYAGFTGLPYTTVLFGRQPTGTFFTDDVVATGLKVAINPADGLTLAGVFYTNIEEDEDLADIPFDPSRFDDEGKNLGGGAYIHQKNLWGLAAIYQNEMLDLQAWYAGLNKVANLFALSAGASYSISDDVALRGKAQWAHSNLAKRFKNYNKKTPKAESNVANSNFFGIDVGASFYNFHIDAGYLTFGKKDKIGVHTLEDNGSLIKPGELIINYTKFQGKHEVWFAKAIYVYDVYYLGLDYTHNKVKNTREGGGNQKNREWVIRTGYKYNDKLSFDVLYSIITEENNDKDVSSDATNSNQKMKRKHFLFEAYYNF